MPGLKAQCFEASQCRDRPLDFWPSNSVEFGYLFKAVSKAPPSAGLCVPGAGMIHISIRADVRQLQRTLDDFARKQVPFAAAQALTALARKVQAAEKAMLQEQLKDPLPFTVNSVRVKAARKNDLRATVYVQDITAAYLQPFILGGKHKLIGKGVTWLNPKHIKLNAYGNIAAGTLARLKARSDIFIGPVKTKAGVVNGIWQRPKSSRGKLRAGTFGKKGRIAATTGTLTLLARFGDALQVKQHLPWFERAEMIVRRDFRREFDAALATAIATARR